MSQNTHRAQVEQAVQALMAAEYPTVPVKYENVSFTQPDGPWVAVTTISGTSFRTDLGSKYTVRYSGIVQIDVLVPEDTGTRLCNEISEKLALLFQEKEFRLEDGARVIYRTPDYRAFPDQRGFYRRIVSIGFSRDEKY